MKVVCAWCNAIIHDGPAAPVSHGICPPCKERELADLERFEEIRADRRAKVLHDVARELQSAFEGNAK